MRTLLRAFAIAFASLFVALPAVPAAASTTLLLTKTEFDTSSPVVRLDLPGHVQNAYASAAKLTFDSYPSPVFAYCIDPFNTIPNGAVNPPGFYELSNIASALSSLSDTTVRKVAWVIGQAPRTFGYDSSVSAAAIWSLILGPGKVTSANAGFQSDFLALAANAQLAPDLNRFTAFVNTNKQGPMQSFAAVPEPATWAMLILGFATIGAMSRQRTRRMAFRTALA